MQRIEDKFKHKIIEKLLEEGIYACATEVLNQDGFPDMLSVHKNKSVLIETKQLSCARDIKLLPLFKKSQPPWYLRYLKNKTNDNLFLLLHVNRNDSIVYHIVKMSIDFVLSLKYMTYSDLTKRSCNQLVTSNMPSIINYIKSYL